MSSAPVAVCVLGPSGRMGRALLDAAAGRQDVRIAAAVDRVDAPGIGQAVAGGVAGGVIVGVDLRAAFAAAQVYIDFTTTASTVNAALVAHELGKPAVIGTTGLSSADEAVIDQLARVSPIVVAANFSLGVNLLTGLVRKAAQALGPSWDVEIVEAHHRGKRDAPSGTALALGRAAAAGHGVAYESVSRHGRDGEVGARPQGEIGLHAVRGGDVVGEHQVSFFGAGERLELAHRATSRTIFAAGALRAAAWVVGQPPGRYDMLDVLELR